MKAMILAAGYGKRLRPLTNKLPKPLIPVNGKPLIQYHLERLASAGVREVVINTAWLGEQIETFLGDGSDFGVSILWSREAKALETGGGIYQALPLLGEEPFILVSSDVWSDYPYSRLANFTLPAHAEAHLVLVPNPEHHQRGDYSFRDTDTEGDVLVPRRKTGLSYTFSGMSMITPRLMTAFVQAEREVQPVFPLREVLQAAVERGGVSGEVFKGRWCDVGTVQRLAELEQTFS